MMIKVKRGDKGQLVIGGIYSTLNLEVEGVSKTVPLQALRLIGACGLKLREAFHIAIMQNRGITTIVSDYSDFDRVKWIKRIGWK